MVPPERGDGTVGEAFDAEEQVAVAEIELDRLDLDLRGHEPGLAGLASAQLAVHHTQVGHHALVGVIVGIKDHGA